LQPWDCPHVFGRCYWSLSMILIEWAPAPLGSKMAERSFYL
jgi:hypothetical protein